MRRSRSVQSWKSLSQFSDDLIRLEILISSRFRCMLRPIAVGSCEYMCDPGQILWDRYSRSWPTIQYRSFCRDARVISVFGTLTRSLKRMTLILSIRSRIEVFIVITKSLGNPPLYLSQITGHSPNRYQIFARSSSQTHVKVAILSSPIEIMSYLEYCEYISRIAWYIQNMKILSNIESNLLTSTFR